MVGCSMLPTLIFDVSGEQGTNSNCIYYHGPKPLKMNFISQHDNQKKLKVVHLFSNTE